MSVVAPVTNSKSDNAARPVGSFTFIVQAHVPYVISHGRYPNGIDWLCERTAETYIPLLNVLNRLVSDGVTPRLTISLSPILCEMLADLSFQYTFQEYSQFRVDAASRNTREFAAQGLEQFRDTTLFWESWYTNIARDFEQTYERDIVGAFRKLQDAGAIEVITSAATHAYLPLLGTDEAIRAQIRLGSDNYKKHFGRPPRGIWLPECAYRPRCPWVPPPEVGEPDAQPVLRKGIDEFLAENQIEYFVTNGSLLEGGQAEGVYAERYDMLPLLYGAASPTKEKPAADNGLSAYEVVLVSSAPGEAGPVACFARHDEISNKVWSQHHGYPGNGYYLDPLKKHFPGGHRLWRVTSPEANLAQKEPYEPLRIAEICEAQANDFVGLVRDSLRGYNQSSGQSGIVCCTFDARLFGHWWFEGTNWLLRVLKKLWQDDEIDLTSGGRYLDHSPATRPATLPEGCWSDVGTHFIWLNRQTAWTWHEIYDCERVMTDLAREHGDTKNPKLLQILQQCARELLLMESSDWQFLITTGHARDYAELRCAGHVNVFQQLSEIAGKVAGGDFMTEGERQFLHSTQERDRCFSNIPVELWK